MSIELDDIDLDRVQRFLTQEIGIDIAEVRCSLLQRLRCWIIFLVKLAASCTAQQCSHLLQHPSQKFRPANWQFDIAFVSNVSRREAELLAQCHAQRCLLSFARMQNQPVSVLEAYRFDNQKTGRLK